MQEWYDFVKVTAEKYGMDPYLCVALAETESSLGRNRVRFGPMGRGTYYGPFGIHKCFLSKWDIADWKVNTEVGISSLAKHIRKQGSLVGALKKYNTEYQPAYYQRIKSLKNKYKKERIFEHPRNLALQMTK